MTTIPVSESQYLGSLELLGRVWAGDDVPSFGGHSPLTEYVNRLSACARLYLGVRRMFAHGLSLFVQKGAA